jgi:thiamine biosynthesis protein ThiS
MGERHVNQLEILVNGEPRRVTAPATVADLLRQLSLDPRAVVVELNRQIIRRPQLQDTPLTDGDAVELVHFVGGG